MKNLLSKTLKLAAVTAAVVVFSGFSVLADGGWTVDSVAKTMSDGDGWVMKCSISGQDITVTGVSTPSPTSTALDLAKGFGESGYRIVAIGNDAFWKNTYIVSVKLPDTLATIGSRSFRAMSALETIEPFLPDSVTSIEHEAFKESKKLGGKLTIGGNGAPVTIHLYQSYAHQFAQTKIAELVLGDGVTEIPMYCFNSCSSLTNVVLGSGLKTIRTNAFRDDKALAKVEPYLPDSVTYIESEAFYNCPIEGELTIGGGGDAVTIVENGQYSAQFSPSKVTKITLGAGVTALPTRVFENCTSCREVVFCGDKPTWKGDSFKNWTDYQSRWTIVSQNSAWLAYLASSANVISPDDIDRSGYTWDDDCVLLGATKASPAKQYLAASDIGGAKKSLTISGAFDGGSFTIGTVSPAYGFYDDLAKSDVIEIPQLCTASQFAVVGNSRYECTGWKLTDNSPADPFDPVIGNTLSYVHAPEKAGNQTLTWLWSGPVAYKIVPVEIPATIGRTTIDTPADPEGFFAAGSDVSLTVHPAGDASFVMWIGDVPEDQKENETITITADAEKTIIPYISNNWVYDAVAKTIDDGYWTLDVADKGAGDLEVKGVKAKIAQQLNILDLAKGFAGSDCRIVAIGDDAFFQNADIVSIKLPNTLAAIGSRAFRAMSALETIEPFLPDSVTSIEYEAFMESKKLGGKLTIGGSGAPVTIAADKYANQFAQTKIAELVLGDGVTEIPRYCFNSCSSLTNVVLGSGLKTIRTNAFRDDKALAKVEPYLPDSVTYIESEAFYNCPIEGELTIGGGGDAVTIVENGQYSAQFSPSKVTKITLGAGVTALPTRVFENCTSCREVVFCGDKPTWKGDSFKNWTACQAIVYVPKDSTEWMDLLKDSEVVTPWNSLTPEVRELFDVFRQKGKPLPYGLFSDSFDLPSQWVRKWNPKPGMKLFLY